MAKEKSIKYDKLIRDRIPEIIATSGKRAVIEILNNEEYKNYLKMKLGEELEEYLESDNLEELADLVEVIYAIVELENRSIDDFEKIRLGKASKRGAFKERLLLKEVIENID